MVKDMQRNIGKDENCQELLYTSLVGAIERNNRRAGQRREPAGVHFIESGEVLVVGSNHAPHTRLNVNDAFGLCDLLRKTVSVLLIIIFQCSCFIIFRAPSTWVI